MAYLPATELRAAYARRELSPVEVIARLQERIAALNPSLGAVTQTSFDQALAAARRSEARYRTGDSRPLDGIPVLVKDLIDTAGLRTTYGASMFATHVPTRDAHAVSRVRAAGAVIIGKSATHEFGWGITTVSEHFPPTRNPWNPSLIAGGSSGGSAAAVAAGFTPLALGTDTAGSVRIPAAFCGIVGVKPSYATVDLAGVFPLAPSLDHLGTLTRTVPDARLLLSAITSRATHERPRAGTGVATGLVVGVCSRFDQVTITGPVGIALDAAAEAMRSLGAHVVPVRMDDSDPLYPTLATIVQAEGVDIHRRRGLWPGRKYEYSSDVRSRLEQAEAVSYQDHLDAQRRRDRIRHAAQRLFDELDLLLSPVSAVPPAPIDKVLGSHAAWMADYRKQVMTYTALQSLTGYPACALRVGFDEHGVPIGVQLTASPAADYHLLACAQALCEATTPTQTIWP